MSCYNFLKNTNKFRYSVKTGEAAADICVRAAYILGNPAALLNYLKKLFVAFLQYKFFL